MLAILKTLSHPVCKSHALYHFHIRVISRLFYFFFSFKILSVSTWIISLITGVSGRLGFLLMLQVVGPIRDGDGGGCHVVQLIPHVEA